MSLQETAEWRHLVTARDRALSCAASRAKAENARMVVYRLPDEPASCYVQHDSLALPEGAEVLDAIMPPCEHRDSRWIDHRPSGGYFQCTGCGATIQNANTRAFLSSMSARGTAHAERQGHQGRNLRECGINLED